MKKQALLNTFKKNIGYIIAIVFAIIATIYTVQLLHDDFTYILLVILLSVLCILLVLILNDAYLEEKKRLIEIENKKLNKKLYEYFINFMDEFLSNVSVFTVKMPVYVSKELYEVIPIGIMYDIHFNFIIESKRSMFSCSTNSIYKYIDNVDEFFECN